MNPSSLTSRQTLRRRLKFAWSAYWVVFMLLIALAVSGGGIFALIAQVAFFGVALWLATVVAQAATNSGKSGAVWGLGTLLLGPVGSLVFPAVILLSLRNPSYPLTLGDAWLTSKVRGPMMPTDNSASSTLKEKFFTSFWHVKAIGVELAVVLIYISTVIAFSEPVQRESYGVLKLSVGLAFAFFLVTWNIEEQPKLLERLTFERLHTTKRWQMGALLALPIAFSWMQNEGVLGALSPPDYWTKQATTVDTSCDAVKSVLASAADSYRVTENKFNMGIATVRELQVSMQTLKIFTDSNEDCLSTVEIRRNEVAGQLKRLGLEKTVVVR